MRLSRLTLPVLPVLTFALVACDDSGVTDYTVKKEVGPSVKDIVSSTSDEPSSSETYSEIKSNLSEEDSTSAIEVNLSFAEKSSSSAVTNPISAIVVPSSSEATLIPENTEYGSCASKVEVIELNGSVVWEYSRGPAITTPMDLLSSKFEWALEGGTPSAYSVMGNAVTPAITYTTSGIKKASLTIRTPNGTGILQCTPLLVIEPKTAE